VTRQQCDEFYTGQEGSQFLPYRLPNTYHYLTI